MATSPTYDVSGHPQLSAEAADLASNSTSVFNGHELAAELIHGLHGTSYSGDELELVKLIIVYQVNVQVENEDVHTQLYQSISEGDRSYSLRDQLPVSPMAEQLKQSLAFKSDAPQLQRFGHVTTSHKRQVDW